MANYRYNSNPIAVGGEKVVCLGRCDETGLDVVLKFLKVPYTQEDRNRFVLEIQRMQQAKKTAGNSVATILDYNVDWDPPFYVEEYYPDGTLAHKMAGLFSKGYVFDVGPALGYCRQILVALHGIHASNQIHRDVKPGNILWRASSKTLVLNDMGIGRTLTRPTSLQTRGMMGTRGYAAPEQELAGQFGGGVDHRADLYAVGVILHEMLTGERGAWNRMVYRGDQRVQVLLSGLLAYERSARYHRASIVVQVIDDIGLANR